MWLNLFMLMRCDMSNVIVVTEEELDDLVSAARHKTGMVDEVFTGWLHRINEAREPIFLGRAEDGMAVYQLQFTL